MGDNSGKPEKNRRTFRMQFRGGNDYIYQDDHNNNYILHGAELTFDKNGHRSV